jgi:hypothetical protein
MLKNKDEKILLSYLKSLPLEIKPYGNEYEYNNPVLTLIDAVLSINRKYDSFVIPRIELVRQSGINSFDQLDNELSKGNEYFMQLWNYKHPERVDLLRRLLKYYQEFKSNNNIKNDLDVIKEWGKQSSVEQFKEWNVKGIAFTTYQYLRMLCGSDTVKPDVHVLRIIENGLGRRVSPKDTVLMIENISKEIKCKARDLDHAIWLFSSSNSNPE